MTVGPSAAQMAACVAVINPAGAGGRARRLWSAAAPVARERLAEHGYKLIERFTAAPGDGRQLAGAAAQSGAAVVLAVGGDGTLHEVVNGLMQAAQYQQRQPHSPLLQQEQQQHSVPALAVLPLGTGCDFARSFGWPVGDVASACTRVTSGKRMPLDVGKAVLQRRPSCSCCYRATAAPPDPKYAMESGGTLAREGQAAAGAHAAVLQGRPMSALSDPQQQQQDNDQGSVACERSSSAEDAESKTCYFANIMSCGVGAEANQISGQLKALGGFAYILGSVLALLQYKPRSLQVHLSGTPNGDHVVSSNPQTLDNVTALVIGNCSFWGAGLRVLPEAKCSDGWLDGVVLQRLGLWDFLTKAHLLRSGNYQGVAGVNALPRFQAMHICSAAAPTSLPAATADAVVMAAEAAADVAHSSPQCVCPCWEIDGEYQGSWCAANVEVLPGALQLCV